MSTLNTEVADHRYGVSTTPTGLRVEVDGRYAVLVIAQAEGPPHVEHYLIHKERT